MLRICNSLRCHSLIKGKLENWKIGNFIFRVSYYCDSPKKARLFYLTSNTYTVNFSFQLTLFKALTTKVHRRTCQFTNHHFLIHAHKPQNISPHIKCPTLAPSSTPPPPATPPSGARSSPPPPKTTPPSTTPNPRMSAGCYEPITPKKTGPSPPG